MRLLQAFIVHFTCTIKRFVCILQLITSVQGRLQRPAKPNLGRDIAIGSRKSVSPKFRLVASSILIRFIFSRNFGQNAEVFEADRKNEEPPLLCLLRD